MLRYFSITLALILCLGNQVVAAEPSGLWLDVPFVKQEKNGCGAASIAMVMQYWMLRQGRPQTSSGDAVQIQRALYSGHAQGIYASDLERYLQQQGFRTFAFPGEWNDLKQQLEKGRPLIVALKPDSGNMPLHYVVVAGLDWEQALVLINDPAQRKLLKQNRSSFEREWSAAGKWTLLAVPLPDIQ
ncbi:MAG TPA: C39 family peptidase [Terriglobales bacterium]|jgi:ABC-type bacteriocin/lantibiotic exporter with double-glycine peptidase domain|nr:C39 family peptidase [Terriglobales bacterium]